jgi:hypothetical protein
LQAVRRHRSQTSDDGHAVDVTLWLVVLTHDLGSGWTTATKEGLMAKTTIAKIRRPTAGRHAKPRVTAKSGATGNNRNRVAMTFSKRKSIEELAAEQGVSLEGQLERVLGAGADLWASDEEFEEFVRGIYDRRRESLSLGKQ